jgi:integrase
MHKTAPHSCDDSCQTRDPEQDSTCSNDTVPQHDLLDVVRAFLQSRRDRGCRESTIRNYEAAARTIVLHFGATAHLASVRSDDCHAFKLARASVPQMCNKEIHIARAIWKFAVQRGFAHSNPWTMCDTYPTGGHQRRKLTRAETAALFKACDRLTDIGRFRRGIGTCFKLVFLTGARISEIRMLKWAQVDLHHPDGPRIMLPEHKTSRHHGGRTIELCAWAAALLQVLPRTSEWCFPPRSGRAPAYPWAQWQIMCELAGVDLPSGQATHSGRITFATTGLDSGCDLGAVMDALGHCDPRSTARYAKFSSQAARRAVTAVTKAMFDSAE